MGCKFKHEKDVQRVEIYDIHDEGTEIEDIICEAINIEDIKVKVEDTKCEDFIEQINETSISESNHETVSMNDSYNFITSTPKKLEAFRHLPYPGH